MGRKTCGLLAALLLFLLTAGCGLRRDPKQIPSIPRNTRRMQDFSYDEKDRPSYPGAVLGVDVSDHQGEIDWEKAAALVNGGEKVNAAAARKILRIAVGIDQPTL